MEYYVHNVKEHKIAKGFPRMHNEFEHEDDNWRPEKSKIRSFLEKFLSIGFVVFAFTVIGFMCFRLAQSKPPESMKKMVWTENAVAAYEKDPDGFKVVHYPSIDSFSEDNMYSINQITYTEGIAQLQATVRYNERALKYMMADKGIEELPEGEIFIFKLRDNFGKVYTDYSYTADQKSGYGYRHVIFDGVDMNDVNQLDLEIYYIGDVGEKESAVATLIAYRYDYSPNIYFLPLPARVSEAILLCPVYEDKVSSVD